MEPARVFRVDPYGTWQLSPSFLRIAWQGVEIVGGHTSQGAELAIGFTVLGEPGERMNAVSDALPGDCLLLTKPIGSGTVLAAHMMSLASGEELVGALSVMARSAHAAAEIPGRHANAMTDVSGFGLAGHLLAMLEGSSVGAELELDAAPVMDGARRLHSLGAKSTLWPENAKAKERIQAGKSTDCGLLFDPQTSGGILATVPPESLNGALAELARANEQVHSIGRIVEGPPVIALV